MRAVLGAVSVVCLGSMAPMGAEAAAQNAVSDYSALAQRYRAARGLEGLPGDPSSLPAAIDRVFAALDVGPFEVCYPWSALADGRRVDELKQIVLGLLDLQARWLVWLDEKARAPRGSSAPAELVAVRKWVAGWKADAIRKAIGGEAAPGDFAAAAGADRATLDAIAALAQGMRTGSLAGLRIEPKPTRILLAATRFEFTGFSAFVGSLDEEWKRLLWTASLPQRNEFHLNELVCLALQNPAPDGGDVGLSMNDREPTGLLEHVTQYAADRLVKSWYGAALEAGVHAGVAVDLVIELFGQNNARFFGSGEGRSTPERKKFVRGGRSQGGKFAKINADSRWRADKGKDFFLKQLSQAQDEGREIAKDEGAASLGPLAHFVLDCKDKPGEHDFVSAPFLGDGAASKEVHPDFFPDYQEFLRAYRAGFVHWLAAEAKSKAQDAAPRPFARLLRSCATEAETPFADRAAAIFGRPLTGPDSDSESLEWQFLAWLARQK